MKRKLLMLLAAACALVLAACTITEGSDDLIMKALILSSKDAGIGAVVKVSVGEVSRKALPSVQSAEEFESFSLTGTKKADGEISGRSGADIERTWTTDGEGNASSKMSAESIEVTAGAEYSFVLEAKKGGATYRGTAEKKMETGENSLSFTLSLSGLSGEGKGSLSVTLSVPGAVKAVEAVLTAEDGSGTASPADAGIVFADGKATYTASEVASGNYVLTFILYADEAKTLKIGEWREYAGITDALTSSSSPAIESAEGLENIYSITLNTNGGTLIGTAPGSYTKYSSTITLPDESGISREGYKFLGWYDAETGGNKVESIVQGSTGEKVLWARWGVTVTFSVNDQITETRTVEYGQTTAQPAAPAVDGYLFKGWVTDEGAFDFSTQIKKDTYIKARLLKKLELKSGPEINSMLLNSLSGGSARKFAKSSEKKDSQYYLDNNQKIPVWYEQESETIWYYLEPDSIMTLAQDSSRMFADCSYIVAIETCDFDTSNVTDMSNMFSRCYNLISLDVSKFDTSEVKNMNSMFGGCNVLRSLDVSKFDTSNVTDMSYMFGSCTSLTSLDVSKFDTSNVTDMFNMFSGCIDLTSLDVSKFNTSKVTNMAFMFNACTNLTSLDVSKFDTSKVTNMGFMFYNCSRLTSLDVSKFDTSKVTDMRSMFYGCSNLTSLDVSKFDTSKVTNMRGMFYYCRHLTSLDVSKFDTSKVTNMGAMFYDCESLTSLDVSKFDTSKVTNMGSMFYYCNSLTSLDVSKFDTSKVTDMSYLFDYCSSLASLDVRKFDTSKVTNMRCMFIGCSNLTSLDVSKFDTSKVTDMGGMFEFCSNLTSLDVSKFDTSKVTNMACMFEYCRRLKELDLSNFVILNDTEDNPDVRYMFDYCDNLATIYAAAGTDWGSIENITSNKMFLGCYSLKGGNNTVYDESRTDITYACIDGLDGKPGYFTVKASATE